jgi:hypothetical protein
MFLMRSSRRGYGFFFSFLNHLRIFAIRLAMGQVYAVRQSNWNPVQAPPAAKMNATALILES